MIFPTSRNVELLTVRETVDETLQFAASRKIEKIEPTIVEEDGEAYLAIPDDQGYPITRERITTAMRG
ncbi:MAG: NUDIX hydrolase, partial [Pseudomonadota bacterium]